MSILDVSYADNELVPSAIFPIAQFRRRSKVAAEVKTSDVARDQFVEKSLPINGRKIDALMARIQRKRSGMFHELFAIVVSERCEICKEGLVN